MNVVQWSMVMANTAKRPLSQHLM